MRLLIELAPFALLAIPLSYLVSRRRAARRREGGRWRVATRALPEGGHVVELQCPGEPSQLVRRLPASMRSERLSDAMAEALAEGEARAATLNSARAMTRRRA